MVLNLQGRFFDRVRSEFLPLVSVGKTEKVCYGLGRGHVERRFLGVLTVAVAVVCFFSLCIRV